tara:strand:+ start:329 stop:490 length:162 start_codon:yes stop_codon:yes gene_type:complete
MIEASSASVIGTIGDKDTAIFVTCENNLKEVVYHLQEAKNNTNRSGMCIVLKS